MKRISIVVLILCAGFVSVAWGQKPSVRDLHSVGRVPQARRAALEPVRKCA